MKLELFRNETCLQNAARSCSLTQDASYGKLDKIEVNQWNFNAGKISLDFDKLCRSRSRYQPSYHILQFSTLICPITNTSKYEIISGIATIVNNVFFVNRSYCK